VPALVLHSEGDRRVPLEEGPRWLHSFQRSLCLRCRKHHAFNPDTRASTSFSAEFHAFLKQHTD